MTPADRRADREAITELVRRSMKLAAIEWLSTRGGGGLQQLDDFERAAFRMAIRETLEAFAASSGVRGQ